METLQTIVQQGTAHKPLIPRPWWLLAFMWPWPLLYFINAVLSVTSNELKRHLRFKLLERVMIREFQKLPM